LHHDNVVGVSKRDVLVDVETKDFSKFALSGKHDTGQFKQGKNSGLNLGFGAAVSAL
jgi:hypothetical protein